MIQRIQSLFLLLVVLLSGLMLILPVYELQSVPPAAGEAVKQFTIAGNALLMIINGTVGVLCFVAIFLYKSRSFQIRLCNLSLLLTCVLTGLLFFVADTMSSGMSQHVEYKYGSYVPLIELLLIYLSIRFIKRDEALVRSADRLR
jgi:hypothetical protein